MDRKSDETRLRSSTRFSSSKTFSSMVRIQLAEDSSSRHLPDFEPALSQSYEAVLADMVKNEKLNFSKTITRMWEWLGFYRALIKKKQYKVIDLQEGLDNLKEQLADQKQDFRDQRATFKQEIYKLKSEIDQSHVREEDKNAEIEQLKKELSFVKLAHESKDAAKDDIIFPTEKKNENYERERLKKMMRQMDEMVENAEAEKEEHIKLYAEAMTTVDELKRMLEDKTESLDKMIKTEESFQTCTQLLKKEYDKLANDYEVLYSEHEKFLSDYEKQKDNNVRMAESIQELREDLEMYQAKEVLIDQRVLFLQKMCNQKSDELKKLEIKHEAQKKELIKIKVKMEKISRAKSAIIKRARRVKATNYRALSTKYDEKMCATRLRTVENKLTEYTRKLDDAMHRLAFTNLEKSQLCENFSKALSMNATLSQQSKTQTFALQALEKSKLGLRSQIKQLQRRVKHHEIERLKWRNQKDAMAKRMAEDEETIKHYQEAHSFMRKSLETHRLELKRANILKENCFAEKLVWTKKITEHKQIAQDQQGKSTMLSHQLLQLRQDVHDKDVRIHKTEIELKHLKMDMVAMKTNEGRLKKKIEKLESSVKILTEEKKDTEKQWNHCETKQCEQLMEFEKVKQRLCSVGSALDRRLVELSLQHEKISILNKVIKQGKASYQERVEDVRLLKLEIKKIRAENMTMQSTIRNSANLRHEYYILTRELNDERQKSSALEVELANPVNHHRWRILEGSDPSKKELIDKVNMLHKKLLKANFNLAAEKEKVEDLTLSQEKMKKKLGALPSINSVNEVNRIREALSAKTDENKVLSALVMTYESDIEHFKHKEENLHKEIKEIKMKYYAMKQVMDKLRIKSAQPNMEKSKLISPSSKVILGGGFNKSIASDRTTTTELSLSD